MVARKARRALTPEAFGRFLRWLSDDDELAVREYEVIRKKLVRYFIHKGCDDPAVLFDETIDVVVGKIDMCALCPNPLSYCFGVARNVWRRNQRNPTPVPLVQDIASSGNPTLEIQELQLNCLEHCLSHLSPSDRDVVTRYHEKQGRAKIDVRRLLADEHGGMNALRISVCRIRKDLRACVIECLKQSAN
jgi:hypothetical protein